MVSTIKFSQFSSSNPNNENKSIGYGGGLNTKQDIPITWTTETRPYSPNNGLLGYNTDLNLYEYWNSLLFIWQQLTTSVIPPSLTWNMISGTSALMLPNNGYVTTNVGQTVFTLPSICGFGEKLVICGYGSGGWKLNFNTGQNIMIGSLVSATTSGSLTSTNQGDQLEILCIVPNTTFSVLRHQGNITVV